jgi:hypothetical protein
MPLPTSLLQISAPGSANLLIRQGDTWQQVFTVKVAGVVVDITGFTATLKIRDYYGSATVLATATCTIPMGSDGKIYAALAPATTTALVPTDTPQNSQRVAFLGYYDLNLSDGTDVVTLAAGSVSLSREITK